jgi:hypothetical protein
MVHGAFESFGTVDMGANEYDSTAWGTDYPVTYPEVSGNTYYVAIGGAGGDGLSWGQALTNLQYAVDLTSAGDHIIVSNGTHGITGTITVANNIVIRSFSEDATDTTIHGGASHRVFNLSSTNIWLVDLGIAGGFTDTGHGAGVSGGSLLSCVASGNDCQGFNGGGAYNAVLYRCTISGNTVRNGGQGGGVANCTVYHSKIAGNVGMSSGGGGGAYNSTIYSSEIHGNQNDTGEGGGGVWGGTLYNCVVYGNSIVMEEHQPGTGVGIHNSTVWNTISWGNYDLGGGVEPPEDANITAYHSCGVGSNYESGNNITNDPLFTAAGSQDFTLQSSSPCIDAGINLTGMTDSSDVRSWDIAGNKRIDTMDSTNKFGIADDGIFKVEESGTLKTPLYEGMGIATNFTFLSETDTTGRVWFSNGVLTNVVTSGE